MMHEKKYWQNPNMGEQDLDRLFRDDRDIRYLLNTAASYYWDADVRAKDGQPEQADESFATFESIVLAVSVMLRGSDHGSNMDYLIRGYVAGLARMTNHA